MIKDEYLLKIVSSLERLSNNFHISERAVTFEDECPECKKKGLHISHLVNDIPSPNKHIVASTTRVASATMISYSQSYSLTFPLKTCLSCGHTTYKVI